MSHRSEERVDRDAYEKRPTSVETTIRIPRETPPMVEEHPDGRGEPLANDFFSDYVQPISRKDHATKDHAPSPVVSYSISAPVKDLPGSPSFFEDGSERDEDEAPPPPDFSTRGAARGPVDASNHAAAAPQHAPNPLSIKQNRKSKDSGSYTANMSGPATPDSREETSMETDYYSQETSATSTSTLPPLQTQGFYDDADRLQPVLEDDPSNFELVAAPAEEVKGVYQLEQRADQLFSREHLESIFADRKLLLKFTGFLNLYRPQSIPLLIFYLDALKALRAIKYANAVAEALDPIAGLDFTKTSPRATQNQELQTKADQAFEILVQEDLPSYIAHTWIQVASVSIQRRVTGTLAPHLREASEGLAEVFCLSDPNRKDNPIVFASEEFNRTTQYGMNYSIGRNCRFLQGPKTSPHSVRRLAEACQAPREHSEVFVNYRRDGSPFMNLLMIAPLYDSKGTLRYFIGAQVDVSGLLKEATDLEGLENLIERDASDQSQDNKNRVDEFQSLSEMFNTTELETVRQCGGRMHRDQIDESDRESAMSSRPRLLLKDPSSELLDKSASSAILNGTRIRQNGKLEGVYQNYLLVRPAPSLRILFTSPSLRVPGILQSPFLSRIGGSSRVRADLAQAFTEGRGVTAKIRWLTRLENDGEDEGRSRWIHCTPLLGHTGTVGVWMVVLVDEEGSVGQSKRRFRTAPPVSQVIGGKEYDPYGTKDLNDRERSSTKVNRLSAGDANGVKAQRARPSSAVSQRGGGASEYSFQLR